MVMDMPEVKDMVQALETAIKEGKVEDAQSLAGQLAQKKAVIDMLYEPPDETKDKVISVKIYIEDKNLSTIQPITWHVKVSTKIAQLKRLMYKKKHFPIAVQRWIVEKRLAEDTASLSSCGVSSDGHTIFLYLMSPKPRTADPGLQDFTDEHTYNWQNNAGDVSGPVTLPTQLHAPIHREGGARSLEDPAMPQDQSYATMPPMQNEPAPRSMEAGAGSMDTAAGAPLADQTQSPLRGEQPMEIGWNCPRCTFLNEPLNTECHVCNKNRPADYVLPPTYQAMESESAEASSLRNPSGQSQRPRDAHQPRPQDPHQPQRPQDTRQLDRPLPMATGDSGRRSPVMVYNQQKMTYEYLERPSLSSPASDSSPPAFPGEDQVDRA